MPERTKAVSRMTERRVGGPLIWNGLYGTIERGQSRLIDGVHTEMTNEVWEEQREKANAEYGRLMEGLDWNRLLIEAAAHHARTVANDPEHDKDRYQVSRESAWGDVCGACIRSALLSEDRNFARNWGEPEEE